MIDGSTRLVGLIGNPVAHSLSPVMHNAAFDTLGLNWRYVPLRVAPDRLGDAVSGLPALGFCGANVTVPYKEAITSRLEVVTEDAARIGAVNTLVVRQARGDVQVVGHNTDVAGFVTALRDARIDVAGERAVVVGAGGGGRAAVAGLVEMGAAEIVLLSRNEDRARAAANAFAQHAGRMVSAHLSAERLVDATRRAALLVHATPVGMWPHVEGSVWPDGVAFPRETAVFDLVYNPEPTRLVRQAAGARTASGIEMLVAQAALAFKLWTGRTAPIDIMRTACCWELGGRSACVS